MRIKTVFGAALAAALVTMAIGASSATATALCVAEQEVCQRVNTFPKGTAVEGTTTEAVFETELFTVECGKSTASGKVTVEDGSPASGQVTAVSFEECEGCVVEMSNLPYDASIEWTAGNDGTFTAEEGEKGAITATVSCPLIFSCTYSSGAVELSAQGGDPGELIADEEVLTKVGGTCPETVTWSAKYKLTTPKPVHVAKAVAGAKLCKTVPQKSGGILKCEAGQGFSGAISAKLEPGKQATFTSTKGKAGTVSCSEAPLSGAFNEKGIATEPVTISFKSGGDCTSTLSGNPTVTVELVPQPYDAAGFEYKGETAPESVLWFTRAAGGPEPTLLFTSGLEECFYELTTTNLPVTNGAGLVTTKALIALTWQLSNGDAFCPEAVAQLTPLELTTKVYVAGA